MLNAMLSSALRRNSRVPVMPSEAREMSVRLSWVFNSSDCGLSGATCA